MELAVQPVLIQYPDPMAPSPNSISEKKRALLEQLKSPSDPDGYKRYLGSPLRYAGGKSLAVGHIVSLLPERLAKLVSPFFGGGSAEIAIAKDLGVEVIGYDVFDILTNYWHYQVNDPQGLADALSRFEPTREEFARVRDVMRGHWDKVKPIEGMELAATYYFNHNTSYGPHFIGSQSSVYLQAKRYADMVEKVRRFQCKNISVSCGSFDETIPNHINDFLYCDPPYYLNGDSRMFVGMYPHRNFPIHHKAFNHEKLRDLLYRHKGGFVLSYNDCSTIREWYRGFDIIAPSWQYTFSQGDTRIGKNRLEKNNGSHVKKSHEILIWKH